MKEGFYLINETLRKGLFEIFKPVNDPTLVRKMSPKVKKNLMTCAEWAIASSKASNICKMCNCFLKLMQW